MVKILFCNELKVSIVNEHTFLLLFIASNQKNNKMETLHFTLVLAISSRMAFGANMACQEVRYAYSAKGMNVYDVPLKPQTGKS